LLHDSADAALAVDLATGKITGAGRFGSSWRGHVLIDNRLFASRRGRLCDLSVTVELWSCYWSRGKEKAVRIEKAHVVTLNEKGKCGVSFVDRHEWYCY
jgi:hypothetical protein